MTKQSGESARDFAREEFRVGGRLVLPMLGRIVFEGEAVQVQPKIMELLVCLARHAGRVVTKAELIEEVWSGAHVTDHALARAVYELRKLFGDSAQRPRVVETIPKIGYRLIAPVGVERVEDGAARAVADGARRGDARHDADCRRCDGDDARREGDDARRATPAAHQAAPGAARAPSATDAGDIARRPSLAVVAAALALAALLLVLTLVLLPGGGHRARHFINHSVRH